MQRLIICMIILLMAKIPLYGQKDSTSFHIAKNALFVEFGGNASGEYSDIVARFSINYDRLLHVGESMRTSVRIGSNFFMSDYNNITRIHAFPILLNLLFGRKKIYFELGAGYEFIVFESNNKSRNNAFTAVIGLRYQNITKGIIARIGLTPTFGVVGGFLYTGTIVGISAGYSF